MLYRFDDELEVVDYDTINSSSLYLGYLSLKELADNYKALGFSQHTVEMCRSDSGFALTGIEICDGYTFAKINVVGCKSSLGVFIKSNMLLVVNVEDSCSFNRDAFMRLTSRLNCESVTAEKLVCSFFEVLISEDNKTLEAVELEIDTLGESVISSNADKAFNLKLLKMKKELLTLRGYYVQLIDISEALRENDNEILDHKALRQLSIFTDKVVRLKENVELLRDSVMHLWDAYQAHLDVKLNQTMKVFTLVTTIFFPITVITSWYGMNFKNMPELEWRYGYLYVAVLSVLVVVVLYRWLKHKKWF